jgi:hypothetical protein
MTAYYNEIDPNAAEWLRRLIKLGAIAAAHQSVIGSGAIALLLWMG